MSAPTERDELLEEAARQLRDARARLEEMSGSRAEPVAVLGAGIRLPGGVEDLDGFWRLLRDGTDAVAPEIPAAAGRRRSGEPHVQGRWAGQLAQVDQFDAEFFGIDPAEATRMDPQQRLVLEVAWEAIEDAGLPLDRLPAATGVFLGAYATDYLALQLADPATITAYTGPGGALSIAANRLSYLLDLHGPSIAVDTACSSSLVAVHLACRALRQGDCDAALVGGVNVIVSPQASRVAELVLPISPTGRCRTFDAAADGVVRAEGCAMLLLQRASVARRPGSRIRGVIRGTAVNQDGASNGLTAPNPRAQSALHRRALADAGADPQDVVYIEAHGTGTRLGDPIELQALSDVYGRGTTTCAIGSVKANVGHLEAAAGVVGLLKAMLVLERGCAPPHLHLDHLNPEIDIDETRFVVPAEVMPLARLERPRLASVSSFGFGGTNAHAVLEAAPEPTDLAPPPDAGDALLLALSARSEAALRELAGRYADLLAGHDGATAADVCAAAARGRTHHAFRAAFSAAGADDLVAQLRAATTRRCARPPRSPRVAFVFSGQGAQWAGMGRALLDREPVVRREIAACDEVVRSLAGWSIAAQLAAPEEDSRLHETEVAQPAVAALQLALAALWRSWGVEPEAVTGHSMGEIVAACVAGALSRAQALELLLRRGRIAERTARGGAMAAIALPVGAVEPLLAAAGGRSVAIAADNGPRSSIVSGEPAAVELVMRAAAAGNVATRRLPGDYGFHSPLLDACDRELADAMADLRPRDAALPLYSTVSGGRIDAGELDASHWGRNLRGRVLLRPAIQAMAEDGLSSFVEIGPHPVLQRDIAQTLEASSGRRVVVGSLRRDRPLVAAFHGSLADLYRASAHIRWDAVMARPSRHTTLPSYPWQRQRFWIDDEPAPIARLASTAGQDVDFALYVRERVAAAARVGVDDVPPNLELESLGLSSLSIVELRNQVERELSIVVPLAALLGGGTPTDLADAIREAVATRDAPAAA